MSSKNKILVVQAVHQSGMDLLKKHPDYEIEVIDDASEINLKSKIPKINKVNVLGPVPAPITRLRKKYRCRILIRYPKNLFIQKYLSQSLHKIKLASGIKLEVDVDPINFS